MQNYAARALRLERPIDPKNKKHRRHGEGHVQVGVSTAQQRTIDMKDAVRIVMSPSDRSEARSKAKPVYEQDEDKDRGKEPKSFPN